MKYFWTFRRFFLSFLGAAVLCACAHEPKVKVGFTVWDASLKIKQSLLECGAHDISNIRISLEKNRKYLSDNEVATIERCMEKGGFFRKTITTCQLLPDLPACSIDAEIPALNKATRLNGIYCKDAYRAGFPACQP